MAFSTMNGQSLTQTVRGTVYDQVTHSPLPGVNVIIAGTDPVVGAVTDINGVFKLPKVAIGKVTLITMMIGYEEKTLSNLEVTSGKELVLQIDMNEKMVQTQEVTISAAQNKNEPLNEMALASTRTFSVEETQRFAAAVNDPARMAVSFAGVVSTDDGNNEISIRGNNPAALQWRMEGVEIPNPNHFAAPGTSGGGISILSAQTLSNSDFLTGAFPAEYGNALSGVFDLKLRKGNNEKRENTIQAGFLGLDLSTEGPFKKGYDGSYLINYRYSTLSIIQQIINVGVGETNFQDLSYNINLPAGKYGNFGMFGFAGLSSQKYDADKDSLKWKDDGSRYGDDYITNTYTSGLTHSIIIGKNSWLRSAASYSYQHVEDHTTWYSNEYELIDRFTAKHDQGRFTLQSVLNHKFNSRANLRAGIFGNFYSFNITQQEFDMDIAQQVTQLNTDGNATGIQSFASLSYRLTEKVTLQPGLHYQYLVLNNTQSIEPRFSVKYAMNDKNSFTLGYGRHSQLQPTGVYYSMNAAGQAMNKNLEMNKADHFVLGYDRGLSKDLHMKIETYYQNLTDIPVSIEPGSTTSILNSSWGFTDEQLVNKGKGRNYGVELTLEQFMRHNFYYLLSTSLFNSEYTDIAGTWHSTKYNTGHTMTLTGGKEWAIGNPQKNRTFGVNVKLIWSGGVRQTPVDLDASQEKGEQVNVDSQPYTIQNPDYFRTDLKFSLKRNRPKSTQTLSLDLQNATNHQNIYGKYYDEANGKIKTYYQTPLIPVLSYKVQF